MSVAVIVLVAMVAGGIGGFLGAAFFEAYMQRRASDHIGEYEYVAPTRGHRAA